MVKTIFTAAPASSSSTSPRPPLQPLDVTRPQPPSSSATHAVFFSARDTPSSIDAGDTRLTSAHAVVYVSGDTRRLLRLRRHAVEHITPDRIDTRSTAAVSPLATTHRPTHGPATSPCRRQRALRRCTEPPLLRRPRTPLAGARVEHHMCAMLRPSKPPHAVRRACVSAHAPPPATSQHVAPAP